MSKTEFLNSLRAVAKLYDNRNIQVSYNQKFLDGNKDVLVVSVRELNGNFYEIYDSREDVTRNEFVDYIIAKLGEK